MKFLKENFNFFNNPSFTKSSFQYKDIKVVDVEVSEKYTLENFLKEKYELISYKIFDVEYDFEFLFKNKETYFGYNEYELFYFDETEGCFLKAGTKEKAIFINSDVLTEEQSTSLASLKFKEIFNCISYDDIKVLDENFILINEEERFVFDVKKKKIIETSKIENSYIDLKYNYDEGSYNYIFYKDKCIFVASDKTHNYLISFDYKKKFVTKKDINIIFKTKASIFDCYYGFAFFKNKQYHFFYPDNDEIKILKTQLSDEEMNSLTIGYDKVYVLDNEKEILTYKTFPFGRKKQTASYYLAGYYIFELNRDSEMLIGVCKDEEYYIYEKSFFDNLTTLKEIYEKIESSNKKEAKARYLNYLL